MREITVLSGKGGTGKTSITAALASLAGDVVLCDSDVDAADLHLILKPELKGGNIFESSWVAKIDKENCTLCNVCVEVCRYDAIHEMKDGSLEINPFQCEGCRLCERVCPEKTISSTRNSNNYWYVSETRFGTLVHAKMGAGEENSGKLVTTVRDAAKAIAKEKNIETMLNDGPPGIGCPVISALTGTRTVLMVIEPTKSGLHDGKRLFELIASFNAKVFALINKFDINPETTDEIALWLEENSIPLLAKLPFDIQMVEAMVQEKTIIEYKPEAEISLLLKEVWEKLTTAINNN
jgi:MinD superfamily P-loop ATPase